MREIKFRGKRTETGKWVYGSLIKKDTDCLLENESSYSILNKVHGYITGCEDCGMPENMMYDVVTETIGQYTGLKDKNGKEIYEGDIIELNSWKGLINCVVEWRAASFIVKPISDSYLLCSALDFYKTEAIRVLGNIYENPELLEG